METISETLNTANLRGLRDGLQALGYVEGKNLRIEYRSADGRTERFPALAKELVEIHVDAIVTRGTPATLAAKSATEGIPIVMAASGEPLMFTSGLGRPGGNITGLSSFVTELHAKRLEILSEVIPVLSRVAAILNMSNPVTPPQWDEIRKAAQLLKIDPRLFDVRNNEDLKRAIEATASEGFRAVTVGTGALIQNNSHYIAELSLKHRLVTMYVSREHVEAGGTISFGPSYPDLYRRAATYLDKVFRGVRPGDLPIEQPVKFELVINLKNARALGIDVPQPLLARADEVIE